MKRIFSTLAVSAMLMGSVQANPFADVPAGHWAYNAINHVVQAGVMKGYRGGMFKGKETVTRYEMAIIISRLLNKQKGGAVSTDVRRTMDRLGEEFMDELDLIGARLTALENAFHEHVTDGGDAGSGTGVKISGEVRVRNEFWTQDTGANTENSDELTWHRTRLNLDKSIDKADIHVQLQYSGSFGDTNVDADDVLSVHQAHSTLHFGEAGDVKDLQVGRFEMSYGDETLIGAANWSNVGRTFDGFRYSSKGAGDDYGFDVFYTNLTDDNGGVGQVGAGNPGFGGTDEQFMGLNVNWADVFEGGLNVFYYLRNTDGAGFQRNLNTLGFNWTRKSDEWGYYVQYAQQSGEQSATADYDGDMLRATLSYDYDENKTIALDYHTYSGDNDNDLTKASQWFELYPTRHAFFGLADIEGQTDRTDLSLHFNWNQSDKAAWGLAYHMITQTDAAAGANDDIADELDLTYSYQWSKDVSLNLGYANYSAEAANQDQNFMWVTTTLKF